MFWFVNIDLLVVKTKRVIIMLCFHHDSDSYCHPQSDKNAKEYY
jgi:hypothetical protein